MHAWQDSGACGNAGCGSPGTAGYQDFNTALDAVAKDLRPIYTADSAEVAAPP